MFLISKCKLFACSKPVAMTSRFVNVTMWSEEIPNDITLHINKLNMKVPAGEPALKYFTYICEKYTPMYKRSMLLGRTKRKLMASLTDPKVSLTTFCRFFNVTLQYLKCLSKRSNFWRFDSSVEDLFSLMDQALIRYAPKLFPDEAAGILKTMGDLNYQNERLLQVLVPRVLNSPSKRPALVDVAKMINALCYTKMIDSEDLRDKITKLLQRRDFTEQIAHSKLENKIEALYQLTAAKLYVGELYHAALKDFKYTPVSKVKMNTVLNTLFHAESDLHSIDLAPYAMLKSQYDAHSMNDSKKFCKSIDTLSSPQENDIADVLLAELKSGRYSADSKLIRQRYVDYYTVDIVLSLVGVHPRPLAIEVSDSRFAFRNDIFVPMKRLKSRWLLHRGYDLVFLNPQMYSQATTSPNGVIPWLVDYVRKNPTPRRLARK